MTNLYHRRPAWLSHAHTALDAAVAAAYGWTAASPPDDGEALGRLLTLNGNGPPPKLNPGAKGRRAAGGVELIGLAFRVV